MYTAKSVLVKVQLCQHYKPAADIQLGIYKFMTAFHQVISAHSNTTGVSWYADCICPQYSKQLSASWEASQTDFSTCKHLACLIAIHASSEKIGFLVFLVVHYKVAGKRNKEHRSFLCLCFRAS